MIRVSAPIVSAVRSSYGAFFARLSRLPEEKCANDVLDEDKVHQNISMLCRCTGLQPSQLQPASEGFESTFQISRRILEEYGQDPSRVVDAAGEQIPFASESFDLVYSSTVLEHTQSPEQVLRESLRVLKPGGHLVFAYPNYGAFFEGHYAIPWIPYLPRWAGRLWLRAWDRDPNFSDTLQFTTYFKTKRWLERSPPAEIITMGQEIFRDRMLNAAQPGWSRWAGLHRLAKWVEVARTMRLIRPLTAFLIAVRSFDPIILTLRKPPLQT